ncbi:MAG TPA: hypothetical protein VFC68_00015 [Treponemataceae bacterium]|nr:hypothetical protein [Treponemataceae bacterium]
MNEIIIKGKKHNFKCGSWVAEQLTVKHGYDLNNLASFVSNVGVMAGFVPKALHLSLCQIKGRNIEAFDLNDVIDYVDDVGVFSEEFSPILLVLLDELTVSLTGKSTGITSTENLEDRVDKMPKKK